MELFVWCSHFKSLSLPVTSATECRRCTVKSGTPYEGVIYREQVAALPAPLNTTHTNAKQQCVYLPSRIPPKSDNRCANCESTVVCAPKRRQAVTAPFAQNSHSFVGTLYQILFILGEKMYKIGPNFFHAVRKDMAITSIVWLSPISYGYHQYRFIKLLEEDPIRKSMLKRIGAMKAIH